MILVGFVCDISLRVCSLVEKFVKFKLFCFLSKIILIWKKFLILSLENRQEKDIEISVRDFI